MAAGALAGAVAATPAKITGDPAARGTRHHPEFEPVIAQHARLGLFTLVAARPFAVLATGAAVLARQVSTTVARIVGALSAVAGLAAITLVTLAGHTGAPAVRGFVVR